MNPMHIIESAAGCAITLTAWWLGDELLLYLRTRRAEAKRRAMTELHAAVLDARRRGP